MKRMLFIFNPHTGGGRIKNRLMEIICLFSGAGYEVHIYPTAGQGHAREISSRYAAKVDLVVCCGGDGTLNEVVDGLMTLEKRPRVGYIPAGTTCDFAASLMLPKKNLLAAAGRVVHPKRLFSCDVGMFNQRAFTYVAAFGAFTDVSYKTAQKQKNLMGYFAYLLEGMQRLPNLSPCRIKLWCDGEELSGEYLLGMVSNSASVAGFSFPGKGKVRMDDGKFEVMLVRYPHNLAEISEISAAFLAGSTTSPFLTVTSGKEIRFESLEPTSWTLDGEFGGRENAARIEVRHQALEIYI